MPILDISNTATKLRLRVGDVSDLPIFGDEVYQSALDDCSGSLVRASKLMAQYILATLTMRVHEKLGVHLEVYGAEYTSNYIKFLNATILNPHMMGDVPIPYGAGVDTVHPILQFQADWNANYQSGTEADQLHMTALGASRQNGFF